MGSKLPPELENHPLFRPGSSAGIMSADAPRYAGELHQTGHEGLRAQLKLMGLPFEETSGDYDGPERAVCVYGPSREQMFDLGRKFGQESVIWMHNHKGHAQPHAELLYTNGAHAGKAHLPVEGSGLEHFQENPENYFTRVPGGKGSFRFNFDTKKLHPVPLNVGTRHPSALAPASTPRPDLTKNLRDGQQRKPRQPHPHAYPWHDGHTQHNSVHMRPGAVLKNDGARTDQSMMFDPARDLKGSFNKGAITDPSMGLQPAKGSFAVHKGDNIGGPNSAGDMSVPPPRGSFQSTNRDHEDGQLGLGKDEELPGEHKAPEQQQHHNDQAAGLGGAPEYQHFAAPFGSVNPHEPQELKHYRYEGRLADVQRQVKDHGFTTYMAGGRHGKPDLANKNYNTKHLMIYDPDPGTGGDFGDANYTHAWRAQHELAHALTYPEVNKLYGEGRRIGKLGTHRSLNEARRAVHWEWLAGHRQRELAKQMGVHVSDEDFAREMNTIMHDAVHRAVTGKFTEPGGEGFKPHQHLVPLETALQLVNEHGRRLGLQDPHTTLQKAEYPELPYQCSACGHKSMQRPNAAVSTFVAECPVCSPKGKAFAEGVDMHGGPPGGPFYPTVGRKHNYIGPPARAALSDLGGRVIQGGREATPPKSGHLRTIKSEVAVLQRILSKSEPQSTASATTEQRLMADEKNADQKFYTPQQARMLLAKALRERISTYAETLAELKKRELQKWEPAEASAIAQRSSKAAHAAGTPRAHYDAAATHSEASTINARAGNVKQAKIHDAASNQHRQLAGHYNKAELDKALSGGMGAGSPQGRVGADALGKVAPPGREDQVRALKPKVGAGSAFKIAWASYNHGKEAKKNMTGGSENMSSGTPSMAMNEGGMPTGHDAMPNPPSSMNLSEVPAVDNLKQKQAVPVKTTDPRSNAFVTAGNNQKSEPKDKQGKTDGRHEPQVHVGHRQQGGLPGDAKPAIHPHGDASGTAHAPGPLKPGGNSPSNKVKEPATTRWAAPKGLGKDEPSMAKPPSGNPATGAVPQAKTGAPGLGKGLGSVMAGAHNGAMQGMHAAGNASAGNAQSVVAGGALGALKGAISAARGPTAPAATTAVKAEMAKGLDIGSMKGAAVQAAGAAAGAPGHAPAAAPKPQPSMADHAQRASSMQDFMPAGKFTPAGGAAPAPGAAAAKPAGLAAPGGAAKPLAPAKPAIPQAGAMGASPSASPLKAPTSTLKPPTPGGAGVGPKPMGAAQHLPKLSGILSKPKAPAPAPGAPMKQSEKK